MTLLAFSRCLLLQMCSVAVATLMKMSCDGWNQEVVVRMKDGMVGEEVDELITLRDANPK